jgi:hypothetical protein
MQTSVRAFSKIVWPPESVLSPTGAKDGSPGHRPGSKPAESVALKGRDMIGDALSGLGASLTADPWLRPGLLLLKTL